LLGYLPVMAMVAWLIPEAAWMRLCAVLARVSACAGRRRKENTRRISRLLSSRISANEAARLATELTVHNHHARLLVLRCYRSTAWRPTIVLIGREHIDAALAAGTGVVFWNAPFAYNDLITKMALHQTGFAVTHLSGLQHGLSVSLFGQRFLNPPWTSVERRFLAERLMMTTAESPGALRTLMRRVKDNQLVSFTMGPNGHRRLGAKFFDGVLTLANGAPALAHRTGAALLPVFTVRRAAGGFVTTIAPPARITPDLEADEAEQQLVTYCVRLLESHVERWPGQFNGWNMADPAEADVD
jgi:lauroyl/myristoyl acyltransferase